MTTPDPWTTLLRDTPHIAADLINACGGDEQAARVIYLETYQESFARGVRLERLRGLAIGAMAAAADATGAAAAMAAGTPADDFRDELMLAHPDRAASIHFAHRATKANQP